MTQKEMRALCKELGITLPTRATVFKRSAAGKCIFCGNDYGNIGNNPAPVIVSEYGSCCNWCNSTIVLRVRLKLMGISF